EHILFVDEAPDLARVVALPGEPHHVTRDVHAEGSRRGVARIRHIRVRLAPDVAGAVRRMADLRAAARARHPAQDVAVRRREAIQALSVAFLGEPRQLTARKRLAAVPDLVREWPAGLRGAARLPVGR